MSILSTYNTKGVYDLLICYPKDDDIENGKYKVKSSSRYLLLYG